MARKRPDDQTNLRSLIRTQLAQAPGPLSTDQMADLIPQPDHFNPVSWQQRVASEMGRLSRDGVLTRVRRAHYVVAEVGRVPEVATRYGQWSDR